ncbi:MAG: 30S ribosomal protein S24e [Thermoplasmata archaeon]|nr:30S ribosomal protein S24e [Thermoplasmata archaeon]
MDLKILEERPNPLLQRVEYRFRAEHALAATPTRETVRVELAKLLNVPKDRLVVERMNARFGTAVSEGIAITYESVAARDRLVREHILIRNKIKEKTVAAPAGAPAEPPAAPPAAKPKGA